MQKAVVIVHGLYMSPVVMKLIERRFRALGYKTYNFGYRTRQYSKLTLKRLHSFCSKITEDHVLFLGHSLGGLVICDYFLQYKPQFKSTKIVTLGTPFHGSQIVHTLANTHLAKWLFGRKNTQKILHDGLTCDLKELPVGVITGTLNVGVGLFFGIENGDGTVSHTEAYLPWATAQTTIHTNHTGLLYSHHAVRLADKFFTHNHF